MPLKKYRQNVCAVIQRKTDKHVLVCHRKGFSEDIGWQFPQGGYDTKKDLIDELKRELLEEIGTDKIEVISISSKKYSYDFPPNSQNGKYKNFCGQTQKWVLAELQCDKICIPENDDTAEFDGYQWVKPEEAIRRIVYFKKNVYIQALKDFRII